MVTPIAINIKMILTEKMLTTKNTEYPIVIHKAEIDNTFDFNGIPFPSK